MSNVNNKKRRSIKNNNLIVKIKEVPLPSELMEQLFDETTQIGYETEEEKEYRHNKEIYNADILKKIKKLVLGGKSRHVNSPYGSLDFTEHQKKIFKLMYIDGLSLSKISTLLNITPSNVRKARESIFKKIKKLVIYDFNDQ